MIFVPQKHWGRSRRKREGRFFSHKVPSVLLTLTPAPPAYDLEQPQQTYVGTQTKVHTLTLTLFPTRQTLTHATWPRPNANSTLAPYPTPPNLRLASSPLSSLCVRLRHRTWQCWCPLTCRLQVALCFLWLMSPGLRAGTAE